MQQSRRVESNKQKDKRKQEVADRHSDATSAETLGDLEKEEKIGDSKSGDVSNEAQVPSPDGTPNQSRDEGDDAGPM